MMKFRLLVLFAVAVSTVGCQSHQTDATVHPAAAADGTIATPAHLQPYAIAPATAPTPMQPGVIYSPLREGTWTYRHVDPKQAGNEIEQRLVRAEDDPDARWRRYDGSSNQMRHLDGEGDGNVVMLAVDDLNKGVLTRFHNAIPVMLTTIKPNEPITASCEVSAVSAKNPDKTIDQGTCTVTLTHIADQKLTLPAGEFDTKLVRLDLNTDMKYVDINSISLLYYAPNVGMVAEDYIEDGRAVIIPWHKERTLVIVDYPPAE